MTFGHTKRNKEIIQRLDSLEYDQALIAQHKRTFHYTRAPPNPCSQVDTAFMPFVLRRLMFSIGTLLHPHFVINERLIQNVLHSSQCGHTRQNR